MNGQPLRANAGAGHARYLSAMRGAMPRSDQRAVSAAVELQVLSGHEAGGGCAQKCTRRPELPGVTKAVGGQGGRDAGAGFIAGDA
jgi:hypothetical protein